MNAGVEERDDLVVHFNCMRNEHEVVEDFWKIDGDAGLASAGRAVQENRTAGNDGDAQSRDQIIGKNEFMKRSIKVSVLDFGLLHALRMDAQGVVHESDGSGAGILI